MGTMSEVCARWACGYLSCWVTATTWTLRWGWGGLPPPPSPPCCCEGSSQTCRVTQTVTLPGDDICCVAATQVRQQEDIHHCPSSPSLISCTTSPLLTDSSWGPAFSQSATTVYFLGTWRGQRSRRSVGGESQQTSSTDIPIIYHIHVSNCLGSRLTSFFPPSSSGSEFMGSSLLE